MAKLQAFLASFQQFLPIWIPILISVCSNIIVGLTPYPRAKGFVTGLLKFLNLLSVVVHSDSPGTLKLPLTQSKPPDSKPPLVTVGASGSAVGLVALLVLFGAVSARAQVVSSGPSLPMLEFQGGNQHPVSFAPGAGYMLSLGFFQRGLFGLQWDLLDVSGAVFGTALSTPTGAPAGQLQAALEIGTLNNILAVGAALPLYGPDNVGVFQGAFKVYPLLSINIPVSFAPVSPPVGIESGPRGLPRGGTLYLTAPVPSVPEGH